MPDADCGLAHEGFQRLIVLHHRIESKALGDEVANEVAAQGRWTVEQRAGDPGQELVLAIDDADLAHTVGIACRERVGGYLPHRWRGIELAHLAESLHQTLEV